jgi:hypothetical protein
VTVHINRPRGKWSPWRPVPAYGDIIRIRPDCCRKPTPREWCEYRWLDEGMSYYEPIMQFRCAPGRGCCTHRSHRKRHDLHDDVRGARVA